MIFKALKVLTSSNIEITDIKLKLLALFFYKFNITFCVFVHLTYLDTDRHPGIEVQLIGGGNETMSVWSITNDSSVPIVTELIHPAYIRKVRIYGGNATGENILQICEFQVYGNYLR